MFHWRLRVKATDGEPLLPLVAQLKRMGKDKGESDCYLLEPGHKSYS